MSKVSTLNALTQPACVRTCSHWCRRGRGDSNGRGLRGRGRCSGGRGWRRRRAGRRGSSRDVIRKGGDVFLRLDSDSDRASDGHVVGATLDEYLGEEPVIDRVVRHDGLVRLDLCDRIAGLQLVTDLL